MMEQQGQSIDPHRVVVTASGVSLIGDLCIPPNPSGLVVFAHGSGSSRASPRNIAVARTLVTGGFATLLFDLLTHEESAVDETSPFDLSLLVNRLVGALAWTDGHARLANLPIGVFGASTGAAAALIASTIDSRVGAVVSRGGRPDLAVDALAFVRCPTLLIVGGADPRTIELNHEAIREMRAPARIYTVPGAGHLFEEPGALRDVSRVSLQWFEKHLLARLPYDDCHRVS